MTNRKHRSRAAGVVLLLGTALAVIAFGRLENQPASDDRSGGITLRHPFALNIEEPRAHNERAPQWRSQPAYGFERQASFSSNELVNLPPKTTRTPTPRRLEPAQRTHRIVEGDTLERLAAKYLGSPERFLELFEANQHLLERPDVLPLGERLIIPPERQAVRPAAVPPLIPLAPLPTN